MLIAPGAQARRLQGVITLTNILKEISEKRDEINRHYWRFTRQAKGNPPPAHLYKELSDLEDKLKKEKKPAPKSRRQSRYGQLVRGWDWRTTAERLQKAEAKRIKQGITRTELLERAIDEYLAQHGKA